MNIWKVRNQNGLFSSGGATPWFKKDGKSWNSLDGIKKHLKIILQHKDQNDPDWYKNCDVVCYNIKEIETLSIKKHEGKYEVHKR